MRIRMKLIYFSRSLIYSHIPQQTWFLSLVSAAKHSNVTANKINEIHPFIHLSHITEAELRGCSSEQETSSSSGNLKCAAQTAACFINRSHSHLIVFSWSVGNWGATFSISNHRLAHKLWYFSCTSFLQACYMRFIWEFDGWLLLISCSGLMCRRGELSAGRQNKDSPVRMISKSKMETQWRQDDSQQEWCDETNERNKNGDECKQNDVRKWRFSE